MDAAVTSRRRGATGSNSQSYSSWKRLWTCCLAGTSKREDFDDAYEGGPVSARGGASSAASHPKPLIGPDFVGNSDPRAAAAPEGQHVPISSQQLASAQTGPGQHALHDAITFSGSRSDQERNRISSSSSTASSKGQPVSHAQLPAALQFADVSALSTDQQHPAPPGAPAAAKAVEDAEFSAPVQVGPVSALALDQPSEELNAPQLLQQHAPPPTQQQHFAADATAGFMQELRNTQQRPINLHPVQHRHLHSFVLDPIDESPRPPPGGSPRTPQLGSAEGLAAATANGTVGGTTGSASAGRVESPRQPQVSLAQGLADTDIYPDAARPPPPPAAAAAASPEAGNTALDKVESPRRPEVSLAQGLADADIWIKPQSAAAAAAAPRATDSAAQCATAAAGERAASPLAAAAEDHSTKGAAAAHEAAEQLERQAPAAPDAAAAAGGASTAGGSSGSTPPASPRSGLATPFTQRSVQALVTQELIITNSNSKRKAINSNSDGSAEHQPASQQQQQSEVGSGTPQGGLPHQQQQHMASRKQRRPLSEEVEEAVVTQIRPARATSLVTGADPSRVWALVAQFDGSKQHSAHTAAVPATVAVATADAMAGRAAPVAVAAAPERRFAAAPNAGTAAAAAAKVAFGVGSSSSSSTGAAVPPSAEEIYAAFSDKISSPVSKPQATTAAGVHSILAEDVSCSGQGIHLAGKQARLQQVSPPTSPHSTGWSEDSNASDVPVGLRKIKVGKCKAPVAIAAASAAASAENSSSNILSGSSASSSAARLQSPGTAAANLAHQQQQQQQQVGSDSGPDSFIPHFTAASGAALNLTSGANGQGAQGSGLGAAQGSGRTLGLPPRPRSSRDLPGLAAGANHNSSSSSNSAGWATGASSSANTSGTKYYSVPSLHIRTGAGAAGDGGGGGVLSPERVTSSSRWSVDEPQAQAEGAVSSLQAGAEGCWGPFAHTQQQQHLMQRQQQVGEGRSSEESEGGKAWEVLPVMPLSPLKVPRVSVAMDVEELNDTPPTPRTSVVGVSNSIIDYMLSEEGIPLVPTSGVDEAAGVHGLDSPFPSGPAIFRSTSGKGTRGMSQVSSWGGGATTPRFSHSSSFSAYGGSNQGRLGVGRTTQSGSFAGVGGLNRGPRGDQVIARQLSGGRGRVRTLSSGEEGDTRSAATSDWQEFQSRGVRSFDMPTQQGGSSGGRVGRLSDPSSSSRRAADDPGAAAIGGRGVEQGEQPLTPRGGSSIGTFSNSGNREVVHDGAATASVSLSSQQPVLPVLPRLEVHPFTTSAAVAGSSADAAIRQPMRGGSSTGNLPPALTAATGARGPSPSDTASVRSGIGSPVSQLAARASAVAAAVAAAAAAGSAEDAVVRASVLPTSGDSSSLNSSRPNDSAAFATSASNLASDAALFSRSGWASMHPQQQQQHMAWQLNVGSGGGDEDGPMSLVETPKKSKSHVDTAALMPTSTTAFEQQ